MKPEDEVIPMDEIIISSKIPTKSSSFQGTLKSFWRNLGTDRRKELFRLYNSGTLILGRAASSGLGYLTWLITARLYNAGEVGMASGVVSAMMLCVQVALFGIGAAVIKVYPEHISSPRKLVNTAINMVAISSLAIAVLFLVFARSFFNELNIVTAIPLYAGLFLAINIFGAVNVLMDHVSIAIKRGDQVLTRNVLFGVTTVIGVAALPLITEATTSITIITAWAAAGFMACLLGTVQIYRSVPGFRFNPSISVSKTKQLVGIGLPNYLLTLAERAPNWVLPIIITELLSPVENARWYAVWMMAWVVFLVPISIGQNLFAEIAENPKDFRQPFLMSMRNSLIGGGIAAVLVILFAKLMLSLMGEAYGIAGATPLRILTLAILPITIIQLYYSVCRGTQRLREATLTALVSGAIGISAAAFAGLQYGLNGMAVGWLISQTVAGLWAGLRLIVFIRSNEITHQSLVIEAENEKKY